MKNLIFDVGGVLIGFRWRQMLADYGMAEDEAENFAASLFEDELWRELDLANIPYETILDLYVAKNPKREKDIRWFFEHSELMSVQRPSVWDRLQRLREKGYRLYLLSNYSAELFEKHTSQSRFMQYFDGGIISWQVHEIKPDPAIYQALLKKYGLKPEECLFFDDLPENLEGAASQGIAGKQVKSEEQLLEMLDELIMS